MSSSIVLSATDLSVVNEVPTIDHLKLAEKLGYGLKENAKNFLAFVDRLQANDEGFRSLGTVSATSETVPSGNGALSSRQLLSFTEDQALYITAKSNKPQAAALTVAMVKVFSAWRNGTLAVAQEPTALGIAGTVEAVASMAQQFGYTLQSMGTTFAHALASTTETLSRVVASYETSNRNMLAVLDHLTRQQTTTNALRIIPPVAKVQPTQRPRPAVGSDRWLNLPATDSQKASLLRNGMWADGMNKRQASNAMDELAARRARKRA